MTMGIRARVDRLATGSVASKVARAFDDVPRNPVRGS